MDFYSLSRKELQTLCKKNKIPANITNIAMADALAALQHVEGLDEFLNQREGDAVTPDIHHRTASRTSTQRKPVREESEVRVSTRHQRGNKAGSVEGVVEQENKDADVPVTPAVVPGSRRRGAAVSTRRKKEIEIVEDDDNHGQGKPAGLPKTPAAAPTSRTRATGRSVRTRNETPAATSVQPAYNTRRSVRMLQKTLSKMSLVDTEDLELDKIDDVSEELSSVSQQVENLSETENGSTIVSDTTHELEVSSLVKDEDHEYQSIDLELDKIDNVSEELSNVSQQVKELSKTETGSFIVSDSTHELEVSSFVKEEDHECQSHYSGTEVKLVSGTDDDVAGLQAEHEQQEEGEVNCDTCGELHEAGTELLSEIEESGDSSDLETENKKCLGTKQDALPVIEVPENISMEVTDQEIAVLNVVVPDDASVDATNQDVFGLLPKSSVNDASMSPRDLVECNIDNQGSNEGDDSQDKNNETGSLNVVDVNHIQNFEPMYGVEEKAAYEKGLASSEGVLELGLSVFYSSGEHQEEELEAKAVQLEESWEETEEMEHACVVAGASSAPQVIEEDASSDNSVAVNKVNMEAENTALISSLLDIGAHKTADQKDISKESEAEAQAEVPVECAADEDTAEIPLVDQEDNSEKLEAEEAQAEESVDPAAEDTTEIPLVDQQVSVESAGSSIDSGSSYGITSAITLSNICDISEDITIPIEPVVPNQLKGDSLTSAQSESESKGDTLNANTMKENLTCDDLNNKSLRVLRKMLKNLTLDGKSNCNTNDVVKDVERKRTALQALPQNQMTKGEAQIDG